MDRPESFEHFEIIKIGEPLEMAQELQTVIDPLPTPELKKEFSLPVIEFMNSQWEMKNQWVNIIGTIIGPDVNDTEVNKYHDFISGLAVGFSFFEIEMNYEAKFCITISVDSILNLGGTSNPLAGPLTQRVQYHALVNESPILELAS